MLSHNLCGGNKRCSIIYAFRQLTCNNQSCQERAEYTLMGSEGIMASEIVQEVNATHELRVRDLVNKLKCLQHLVQEL